MNFNLNSHVATAVLGGAGLKPALLGPCAETQEANGTLPSARSSRPGCRALEAALSALTEASPGSGGQAGDLRLGRSGKDQYQGGLPSGPELAWREGHAGWRNSTCKDPEV